MWDYSELKFEEHVPLWRLVPPKGRPGKYQDAEELLRSRQRRQRSLNAAPVVSWDDQRVTILCPFCERTHNHGNSPFKRDKDGAFLQDRLGRYTYDGPSTDRCNSRVPHCDRPVTSHIEYVLIFPFEDDSRVSGLSFELQQKFDEQGLLVKEQFCTVGLAGIPKDYVEDQILDQENALGELEQQMQSTAINDGEYNVATHLDLDGVVEEIVNRASDLVMAAACSGDCQALKRLLANSPNAHELRRIQTEDGISLLSLAVPNGHRAVVEYLLDEGSDPNVADHKGRTPLMEAALWGYPSLVDLLLQHGADKHRKDRHGRVAGCFAEELARNEQERHDRSLKYSEDPIVKKGDRKLIRALLGHSPPRASPPSLRALDLAGAHFHKSPAAGTISLVIPRQGIEIVQQQKTAAILVRDDGSPLVAAVSGRTSVASGEFRAPEAGFERLNEGYWGGTENFNIAHDIGFEFEPDYRDKVDKPGSFHASHAEAQLMCFFVRRNYLFRNPRDEPVKDDFLQLFLLQPRNQRANIIISKTPCCSCLALSQRIRSVLGIHFTFDILPVR